MYFNRTPFDVSRVSTLLVLLLAWRSMGQTICAERCEDKDCCGDAGSLASPDFYFLSYLLWL